MSHVSEEARLAHIAADILTPEELAGEFLSELEAFLGANTSVVYYFTTRGRLDALGGGLAPTVPEYERRFAALDPLMQSSRARGMSPFLLVQQPERCDVVPDDTFRRSEVYQRHYHGLEVDHLAFLYPSQHMLGEPGMVGFLLGRRQAAGPFEDDRLTRLRTIEPGLRAAVRRVLRARAFQQQRDALAAMLARAEGRPVVVLDQCHDVSWASREAVTAFEQHRDTLSSIQQRAAQLRAALDRPTEVSAPWTFRDPVSVGHVIEGEFEIVRDRWLQPTTVCRFRIKAATRERRPRLTKAEARVLEALTAGLSNKEIGEQLGVSVDTVRTHVRRVLAKLEVDSRVKAALWAIKNRERS